MRKYKKKINFYRTQQYLLNNVVDVVCVEPAPDYNAWTQFTSYQGEEAYLQSLMFAQLRERGIITIPEFRDGRVRYDLLVMKNGRPFCIVEIKGDGHYVKLAQIEKYEQNQFKIPVYVVRGRENYQGILEAIVRKYFA